MRRHAACLLVALLAFFSGCTASALVRDYLHNRPPKQHQKVTTYVTVEYRYTVY